MRNNNQIGFTYIKKVNTNRIMLRLLPLMLLVFLSAGLLSCNKANNEIVNKIKGKWKFEKKVDSQGETITSGDEQEIYMNFDKCNLKENKENYCSGSMHSQVEGEDIEYPFEYRIEDDGKTLIQKSTASPTEVTISEVQFEGDNHMILYEDILTIDGKERATIESHYVRVN